MYLHQACHLKPSFCRGIRCGGTHVLRLVRGGRSGCGTTPLAGPTWMTTEIVALSDFTRSTERASQDRPRNHEDDRR